MRQILPIEKTRIPYSFELETDGETYRYELRYNTTHDYFSVRLLKGEIELTASEKISLKIPMFEALNYDTQGNHNADYPKKLFMPIDVSGQEKRITWANFYTTVYIFMFDRYF